MSITVQSNYRNSFQKSFKIPSRFKFPYLKTNGAHGNLAILDIKPFTCNNATF